MCIFRQYSDLKKHCSAKKWGGLYSAFDLTHELIAHIRHTSPFIRDDKRKIGETNYIPTGSCIYKRTLKNMRQIHEMPTDS